MKKVGAFSTALLGSVITAKVYQNHNKKHLHKMTELAKPYLHTLKENLLDDISEKAGEGKKTCVIIGGGVAGIASAYELCEKGHSVILLEKCSGTGLQCSAAPAGGMQRSNPTVDSSMWIAAVQSILGLAPFQYFRINFWETLTDPHFLRWFAGFTHNSAIVSDKSHEYYQRQLLNFTNWAIDDIMSVMKTEGLEGEAGLVRTGALQLYYDLASFEAASKKIKGGFTGDGELTVVLSREEVLALEPCLAHIAQDGGECGSEQLVGGTLQTFAASGSCAGYTTGMMRVLRDKHKERFQVESGVSVLGFETEYGQITQVHTSRGTLAVPVGVEVVVAAGSWTPLLLRKLNLYCPVYPMKGYNLIVDLLPAGLQEADFPSRVVIDNFIYSSTLNKQLRVASFGEFDGWDTRLNPPVVHELKQQAGRMYPPLRQLLHDPAAAGGGSDEAGDKEAEAETLPPGVEIKTGLRPFVSDGRLLLGKVPEYHNLFVNVGPGFNGWKVATGAAKVLVADITRDTSGLPDSFDTAMLAPEHRVVHSPKFCHLTNLLTYNE